MSRLRPLVLLLILGLGAGTMALVLQSQLEVQRTLLEGTNAVRRTPPTITLTQTPWAQARKSHAAQTPWEEAASQVDLRGNTGNYPSIRSVGIVPNHGMRRAYELLDGKEK